MNTNNLKNAMFRKKKMYCFVIYYKSNNLRDKNFEKKSTLKKAIAYKILVSYHVLSLHS